MDGLERAMAEQRAAIEAELARAEAELTDLRERERRLEDVIRRARAMLGPTVDNSRGGEGGPAPVTFLPLHEAMAKVLRENRNRVMSARELADAVNASGLYRTRDGSPVEIGQIHARAHNYGRLFERAGGGLRLRDTTAVEVPSDAIERFDAAMLDVYASAMREVGYPARRFLAMVRGRGGLEAARTLLAKPGVSEGFRRLAEGGKFELTMEYQVLTPVFAPLFTEEERRTARTRLLEHGCTEDRLPR